MILQDYVRGKMEYGRYKFKFLQCLFPSAILHFYILHDFRRMANLEKNSITHFLFSFRKVFIFARNKSSASQNRES